MMKKEKPEIIEVEPQDPNKKNSPIKKGPKPKKVDQKDAYCWWNGNRYSTGAVVVQAGKRKICLDGQWWDA